MNRKTKQCEIMQGMKEIKLLNLSCDFMSISRHMDLKKTNFLIGQASMHGVLLNARLPCVQNHASRITWSEISACVLKCAS